MPNQIQVIAPYWDEASRTWVFDDERVDLHEEPFVAGMPEMINMLIEREEIAGARDGFRMLFSPGPFPGFHMQLERGREEAGGYWYTLKDNDGGSRVVEGWLCPALFCYFDEAPSELHIRAEAR